MFSQHQRGGHPNFPGKKKLAGVIVFFLIAGIMSSTGVGTAGAYERSGSSERTITLRELMRRLESLERAVAAMQRSNSGSSKVGGTKTTTTKPKVKPTSTTVRSGSGSQNGSTTTTAASGVTTTTVAGATTTTVAGGTTTTAAPLVPLGNDCSNSQLEPHTGFQLAPKCVETAFGEVSEAAKNPSLLIVDSPASVKVNTRFTISVSTRNLVRDRFLAAAQGGYYLESSFLNAQGLQRGHFHTACRIISDENNAPDGSLVPAFFKATEDGKGGAEADTVIVEIPNGLPVAGNAQCAVWAGDGSHRIPMMQRANQTPAFDVVRVEVTP